MKRLNIFLIFSFILAVFTGCVKDEAISDEVQYELTAKMEMDASTRTSLSGLQGDMYYPLWSAGDELAVFVDGETTPSKFTLKSGEGATKATFAGTREGSYYYALYPFSDTTRMENGAIHFTLPSVQEYIVGSFGSGSYPMVAYGTSGTLNFKNLCAVMKISITGDAAVRSITLQSKDEEAYLSGKVKVNFGDASSLQMQILEGGSNSVRLDCKGTELKKDSVTDFHFVIPAQSYKGGFDVIIDAYSDTIVKSVASDLEFKRSQLRHLRGMELNFEMDEHQRQLTKEKAALIEFYEALDGDNWKNNENWCSDKPVDEWYGVTIDSEGRVLHISLYENNLRGIIPESIGNLSKLEMLSLSYNYLSGEIPVSLGKLLHLKILILSDNSLSGSIENIINNLHGIETLWLGGNNLKGEIPGSIENLRNLESLEFTRNQLSGKIPSGLCNLTNLRHLQLGGNNFSGSIPEDLIKLQKLERLYLCTNNLSGNIPESFYDWDLWKNWWGYSIVENNFKFENMKLPAPEARVECFNGKVIDLADEYPKNKYTVLFGWCEERIAEYLIPQLNEIHDKSSENGIKIIGWAFKDLVNDEAANEFIKKYNILWDNFSYKNTFDVPCYPSFWVTSTTVVDSTGRIVFSDLFDRKIYEKDGYLKELIENDFKPNKDQYTSTDYTQDGTTVQLQKAAEGNGINIVLMGDGYSDRQIADGSYKADMEYVYSNLFTKEPYKSYKHLFNVSYVNAVSATEGFEYGNTALSCGFGDGTYVYGNDNAVFKYAQKVVDASAIDETLMIVVMNSNNYAGTCFTYYPNSSGTDHGKGAAVAYFPKGESSETFAQLLHHEANGHGFAKLADEYANEEYGAVPAEEVENTKNQQSLYGWWKNVDFTNDPAQVRWKKFLEDTRYAKEGLGVFEGGLTYWSGVWRPTENSIMRYNQGEFNAPSREAIYYRIHKLAYGADWKYDYEKFVEYDAVNYNAQAAPATKVSPLRPKQQLHPPVVIKKSWREAGN